MHMSPFDNMRFRVKLVKTVMQCIFNNVIYRTIGLSHETTCFYSDGYTQIYNFEMKLTS